MIVKDTQTRVSVYDGSKSNTCHFIDINKPLSVWSAVNDFLLFYEAKLGINANNLAKIR